MSVREEGLLYTCPCGHLVEHKKETYERDVLEGLKHPYSEENRESGL